MPTQPTAPTASELDYAPLVAELRAEFASGLTRPLAWRLGQLERLLPVAIRTLYGADPAASPDYGRIVNDRHFTG